MSFLPDHPVLAIAGVTGAVGRELVRVLEQRAFPARELRLLASTRSAGVTIPYGGDEVRVEALTASAFDGVDLAWFCASGDVARELVPAAVAAGARVIDNSSAYRMDPAVPLVVPEINRRVLDEAEDADRAGARIIANPNCSTIIALMAVDPLYRAAGVARMVVSTYQAISGAGAAAMAELEQQARDYVGGRPPTTTATGRRLLFNVFCHESPIDDAGANEEEAKLVRETRKIWGDDDVRVAATCVRVPVLRAHCASINVTLRRPMTEHAARAALAAAPGVRIVDDRPARRFPEPLDASGGDDVLVGRIRADESQPPGMGLSLFVAGDQLRKGAALNAVQIAECFVGAGV